MEQHARLGLREHVAHLARAVAEVDRHVDRTQLGRGEVDGRVLDAVLGQRGDPIAAADAERAQRVREAVRHRVEPPVGDALGADHVGGLLRAVVCLAPHDVAQEERHGGFSSRALPRVRPSA